MEMTTIKTPLYPTFEKRIRDAVEHLVQQQITPWSFLETGRQFSVKQFDGKEISYQGIKFEGSPREVFWSSRYIKPFLEDLCISQISAAVAMAKERDVDVKALLAELQYMLMDGIRNAYNRMAKTDRLLRERGYPDKVPLRSVEPEIQVMERFLEEQIKAEMAMCKPKSFLEEWYKKHKFWVWVIPIVVTLLGGGMKLSFYINDDSVSGDKTVIGQQVYVGSIGAPSVDEESRVNITKIKIKRVFEDFFTTINEIAVNFPKESENLAEQYISKNRRGGVLISAQMNLSLETKKRLDNELTTLKRKIEDVLIEDLAKTSLQAAGKEFDDENAQLVEAEKRYKEFYPMLNDSPKSWEMKAFGQLRLTKDFDVGKI